MSDFAARDLLAPAARVRDRLRVVRRVVLRRRRLLAALATGVAVAAGLSAARPTPPASTPVAVLAHDVAAGTVLGPGDLREVALAPAALPDHLVVESP